MKNTILKKALKKIYRLSDTGCDKLFSASIWMALFHIAVLFPVVLFAMVADEMLKHYFAQDQSNISVLFYLIISTVILLSIFLTYRIAYEKKYIAAGEEEHHLRMNLADKIRKLPLSYLGRRNLSDLTTAIMEDASVIENILSTALVEFLSVLIFAVVTIIALFIYNWKLSLALCGCIPFAIIILLFSKKISEGVNKGNKKKKLAISDGLQEYLENIKVLRTSEKMGEYQASLSKKIKKIISGLIIYEFLGGFTISTATNLIRLGLGIVIIFSTTLLIKGEITLITFLLFLLVTVRIYEPLSRACEKLGGLIYSLVSAKRISDLLDYPIQEGKDDIQLSQYDIDFEHVTFSYQEEEVICDVSFSAKQGQITALVGPSGSGKSTLTKLAARFWDVQKGNVSLGGVNVNEISPESLLQHYSIVFQDVVLFNDTIYNNIKIGKKSATKEEIMTASKLARCDEFISKLPNGYQTIIGENGMTLSGGERQRLSIARAFLKDAPVILLDESTASIDPENETKIQEAIGKLIQNKTVLIIAHKLRAIVDCDKIVVLEKGRIIEEGTHQELLNNNRLYKRMYELQNESMQWKVMTNLQ